MHPGRLAMELLPPLPARLLLAVLSCIKSPLLVLWDGVERMKPPLGDATGAYVPSGAFAWLPQPKPAQCAGRSRSHDLWMTLCHSLLEPMHTPELTGSRLA